MIAVRILTNRIAVLVLGAIGCTLAVLHPVLHGTFLDQGVIDAALPYINGLIAQASTEPA